MTTKLWRFVPTCDQMWSLVLAHEETRNSYVILWSLVCGHMYWLLLRSTMYSGEVCTSNNLYYRYLQYIVLLVGKTVFIISLETRLPSRSHCIPIIYSLSYYFAALETILSHYFRRQCLQVLVEHDFTALDCVGSISTITRRAGRPPAKSILSPLRVAGQSTTRVRGRGTVDTTVPESSREDT